ncbi:MAG: acyltransferase [Rhodospirillaceae bacterium]|nr:acyltransferase [Rhodospirillaceae bacterium]
MGLLRVILALSVVLAHLGGFFGWTIAGGFAAVQMFYIISGFYMATILTEKYDPRRDIAVFYSNRSLRIYSAYWAVLLISLVAYYVIHAAGKGGWWQYVADNAHHISAPGKLWLVLTNLLVVGQESTLFMKLGADGLMFSPDVPGGDVPIWRMMPIPQAWTLSLELMFYALAPFLARLRTPGLVAVAAASIALRIAVYAMGYQNDPWLSRFFPHELALFVMGMLARRFYDAHMDKITHNVQIGLVVAFFAVTAVMRTIMEAVDPQGIEVNAVIWPYYLAAIVVVPCLFQLTRNSAWDSKLGNYSYPLYLTHWIVLTFYDAFAQDWGLPPMGSPLRVLICVAATFALSWVIIVSVEAPTDRYRQRRAAAAHA